MKKDKINTILSYLMEECAIEDIALSRKTGVPPATIARLRTYENTNPTIATLKPLANFFKITIGQLIGNEPLSPNRIEGYSMDINIVASIVPVLKWDQISYWLNNDKPELKIKQWIPTEKNFSKKSFAIKLKNDYGLFLKKDSIVILDPEKQYKNGDFVLIVDKKMIFQIMQIMQNDESTYLKSINPEVKRNLFINDVILLGPILEIRYNIQEEYEVKTNENSGSHRILNFNEILINRLKF